MLKGEQIAPGGLDNPDITIIPLEQKNIIFF